MREARSGEEIAWLDRYGVQLDLDARRPAPLAPELRERAERLLRRLKDGKLHGTLDRNLSRRGVAVETNVTEHFTVAFYFDRIAMAEASLAASGSAGHAAGGRVRPALRRPLRARIARRRRVPYRERRDRDEVLRAACASGIALSIR